MEGQRSQSKLTRTQSSLLRSSPTVRSSIQSLSSVDEIVPDQVDVEEQKPHRPGSNPVRSGSSLVFPVLALTLFSLYTFFVFFRNEDIPISENLLLALIFLAVVLFFAGRNKGLIHQSFRLFKHSCDEYAKKLGLSRKSAKPVHWFIGEADLGKKTGKAGGEEIVIAEAVEAYSNGDYYEGEFHKGKCNGSGVYHFSRSGRYEGDWVDGRYDGYGVESWTRGSRYHGQFRQGLRHGYGLYRFYTGDSYAGKWFNGQSHGIGIQTCCDGSCYIGEFKCGVKHGLGCYHFRNGDRYAGEYFGDKIHGFGVYHFANGHSYEGSWHEGRKQGYGMYTFRNGETKCGEWDGGNLKTPFWPPLSDSILLSVQAARKTAEKAIQLPKVDDQVKKAVMAANKAATAARVAAIKAVHNRIEGQFLHH